MLRVIVILVLFLAVPSGITAENSAVMPGCEIIVDDFVSGIKPGWRAQSFHGLTEYAWTREGNRGYVRANSRGAASGLYYEIKFEARQYPYLTWQWKVDNIIASGDETRKSGDDYGARIYVVFPAFFFLEYQGN